MIMGGWGGGGGGGGWYTECEYTNASSCAEADSDLLCAIHLLV